MRQIVINCYKYHGREDLIPVFNEEEEKKNMMEAGASQISKEKVGALIYIGHRPV